MSLNVYTLIPLFALIVYGVILLLLILSRPPSRAQVAFRGYLFAMLAWSLSAFVVVSGMGDALIWFRLMIGAAVGSMVGIFHFVQRILHHEKNWAKWVYLYGAVCIFISVFTDAVVHSASVHDGVLSYEFTSFIGLVAGPGYALTIFSLLELLIANHKAKDALLKNRYHYLVLGLGLMVFASLINWTPLGRYPVDIAANGVTALLITYAILRHRLLDISLVVRKGLLYSVPTTILGAIYFLIISLALNFLHVYSGMQIFLLSLVVAMLAALVAQTFQQKVQVWIDKVFFREKYDANLLIRNFSRTAASVLDLDRLTSMILDEIMVSFHVKKTALFLRDQHNGEYYLAAHRGLGVNTPLTMRKNHPLIIWFSHNGQALLRESVDINPFFKSLWKKERLELDLIGVEIFVPLLFKDNLIGILALGPKMSELSYSHDDQVTLTTLADQMAIAVENALLYDAELSRREELDALYHLTRQLLDTNHTDTVLERIVYHVTYSAHVSFSAILMIDEEVEEYQLRSVFPEAFHNKKLNREMFESASAQYYYQYAGEQKEQVVLTSDETVNGGMPPYPGLREFQSVCITPMLMGDKLVGMLVLGEARSASRDSFDDDKMRLLAAVSDQAASALHRAKLYEQLEDNFMQTVLALANAMDARDTYTHGHSARLATLAEATLYELTQDSGRLQSIHWAALLHDIGKIGVNDEILRKAGPLTLEEWDVMKQHPEIGAEIIKPIKELGAVAPVVRSHHEKFDGSGYPYGLAGEDIPIEARVLAVVDAYDAMVDDRVYREAMSQVEALTELKRCSGTHFDPSVVDAFLNVIERQAAGEQLIY